MTTASVWSDTEQTEVEPVKKRKPTVRRKVGGRDPEDIDTCDLTALAWKVARYRQASALALDDRRERFAVRALVRAGMTEAEALEVARRVYATYRERWEL